jgi:2,3-bisphosphoglycerate-dependent phosphoglycerate mutase
MRTIYVVQHPQATHHFDRVVGGQFDSTLTPRGERDADAVVRALRNAIPASAAPQLFSSDLRRTSQTAAPIGALLGVTPILDRRLREKSYGEAEGRPQEWLDQRVVPPPADGDRMNHDEGVAGAETMAAFAERVYAAMETILESDCEHQIVVTHGFVVTFLIASWIKMPIASVGYVNFRAAPGSITVLREDDYWHNRQVASLSDTRHLTA